MLQEINFFNPKLSQNKAKRQKKRERSRITIIKHKFLLQVSSFQIIFSFSFLPQPFMNRLTLAFSKQDLEKEYFQTVAFPHYFKIFSIWCKLLIFFAIPAVIYTYATDNFQYVGYTFCIIASGICLFTVHKKPAAFNYVIAIYNLSFVALNVLFILNTDKNIGAKGSDNVMMFIFAGKA